MKAHYYGLQSNTKENIMDHVEITTDELDELTSMQTDSIPLIQTILDSLDMPVEIDIPEGDGFKTIKVSRLQAIEAACNSAAHNGMRAKLMRERLDDMEKKRRKEAKERHEEAAKHREELATQMMHRMDLHAAQNTYRLKWILGLSATAALAGVWGLFRSLQTQNPALAPTHPRSMARDQSNMNALMDTVENLADRVSTLSEATTQVQQDLARAQQPPVQHHPVPPPAPVQPAAPMHPYPYIMPPMMMAPAVAPAPPTSPVEEIEATF